MNTIDDNNAQHTCYNLREGDILGMAAGHPMRGWVMGDPI